MPLTQDRLTEIRRAVLNSEAQPSHLLTESFMLKELLAAYDERGVIIHGIVQVIDEVSGTDYDRDKVLLRLERALHP